jgi:hypothetical protein
MASIIWSGDIFSLSFSLHRAGERKRSKHSCSQFGKSTAHKRLVIFLQDGDDWTKSHITTFSGMEPSYVLPDNVAIITLQVCIFHPNYYLFYPFVPCCWRRDMNAKNTTTFARKFIGNV